jgi:hypothetical protein
MNFYTYQLGLGEDGTIHTLTHSEMIAADNLRQAVVKAKEILAREPDCGDANVVRLLDDVSGVVWFRGIGNADGPS